MPVKHSSDLLLQHVGTAGRLNDSAEADLTRWCECDARSLLPVFQLDPQTVQSKNWHMDVIEMNGVRLSSSSFAPNKERRVRGLCVLSDLRFDVIVAPCGSGAELSSGVCLQIKVEFSMKFTSRDLSLKRTPSKKQSGVFGVKINVVTK